MKATFVDTNIFIYASGDTHHHKIPSMHFLEKVAKNKIEAVCSAEVLQEILHRFCVTSKLERGLAIFDDSIRIIPLILPVSRQDMVKARDILQKYPTIEARDATHVAVMLNHDIKTICSYDKHYDQIKEIKRIEP